MKYVKITKIEHKLDAEIPAAEMDDWEHGTAHPETLSLPVGYWVEGWMTEDPLRIGQHLRMERWVRNGVKALGMFTSSPIVSLTSTGFCTENSVYLITPVTPPKEGPLPRVMIGCDSTY